MGVDVLAAATTDSGTVYANTTFGNVMYVHPVETILIVTYSYEAGTWDGNTDGLLGLAYDDLSCSPTCSKAWLDEIYTLRRFSDGQSNR